jgi:hypothetical protein
MRVYRRSLHRPDVEATMVKEVQYRQRSLLEEAQPARALPKEVAVQALDQLVQLLIAVIPAIEAGEQNE